MTERDPLEKRDYAPTVPDDLDDPPQFGQFEETLKDILVLELRQFFNQPKLNIQDPERRREIPTVRKYAVGFGPGTDPYETVQQIVQEWFDANEKLPHAAVTAVQGQENRLTLGQPFIGHTQLPPRVITLNGPFVLAISAAEIWTVQVVGLTVGERLAITLNDQDFEYVVQAGDTTQIAAKRLFQALSAAVPFFTTTVKGSTLTITNSTVNEPFTPGTSPDLTAAQVQAAGSAATDYLTFRSTPDKQNPFEETIYFYADRFPLTAPATAALATDVVRVFNSQARFVRARVDGNAVRFSIGGSSGGNDTPNEIEVTGGSPNALAVFGLGSSGTGNVTGSPPDTPMTFTSTGVGTAAAAAVGSGVTAYIHLTSDLNGGRFPVLSIVDANTITYAAQGEPESSVPWFIGKRDDWTNPARPKMNRRHACFKMTASVSILAEDPNERTELSDLVLNEFAYYLELKYFQFYGRGTFDAEAFPDEHFQFSIAQGLALAGQSQIQRPGGDAKNFIFESRITIPLTGIMYQDRKVLVPYGPSAGLQWVITGPDIQQSPEA